MERIALVGMGWIGEHLRPCYESYLGTNLPTHMMAFKRSISHLEALRARYPFPILAGDYREAFLDFAPTFIILSTIPTQIKPVTEGLIKPYVDSLREKGHPLPLILSFAPSPDVRYFAQTLGEDVDAFTVLPAMETEVNGVDCSVLSNTMLTPNPQVPPAEENLKRATRFLEGLAQVFVVPLKDIMPILAGKITFHMLDLACQQIPAFWLKEESGYTDASLLEGGQQYAGGRMRGLFMAFRGRPCAVVPCPDVLPAFRKEEETLNTIQHTWYQGVMEFLQQKKAEGPHVQRIMDIALELHLLCLQMESPETILNKLKSHATPGGMSERAVKAYNQKVEEALYQLLVVINNDNNPKVPEAVQNLRQSILWLAEEIYQKGISLAG